MTAKAKSVSKIVPVSEVNLVPFGIVKALGEEKYNLTYPLDRCPVFLVTKKLAATASNSSFDKDDISFTDCLSTIFL